MQDLTLMQAAIQKMHWNEARQKVLAQNVANVDTPGYTARDIDPLNFKALLEASSSKLSLGTATAAGVPAGELATTDAKHLGLNGGAQGKFPSKTPAKGQFESSPSGNSVTLEEQLLKMSQNDMDHHLTTTIYQKTVDMLKDSIRTP